MSNFSNYFNSGGGLSVNSYKDYLVAGTGNPPGYDASTGLYNHPDSTVWIETGNQISAPASTYPDATQQNSGSSLGTVLVQSGSLLPSRYQFGNVSDIAYDAATDYLWISGRDTSWGYGSGQIIDLNGSATTPTWTVPILSFFSTASPTSPLASTKGLAIKNSIGYLSTVPTPGTTLITEYTAPGPQPGTTYTLSHETADSAYDAVDDTFWFVEIANTTVYQYNNDMSTQISSFSTAPVGITGALSITNDGVHVYVANASNSYQFTKAGAYTGFSFPIANNNSGAGYASTYSAQYYGGNSVNQISVYQVSVNFGDSTVRTNAETGQPYFLRIK
jgi:hypothetical protein